MYKLTYKGEVIAESDQTVEIEGNQYFPPDSVRAELKDSPTEYTCPWKGEAQYHHVIVNGETLDDAAWSYPNPKEGSVERVGQDFAGYIAFYIRNGVELEQA